MSYIIGNDLSSSITLSVVPCVDIKVGYYDVSISVDTIDSHSVSNFMASSTFLKSREVIFGKDVYSVHVHVQRLSSHRDDILLSYRVRLDQLILLNLLKALLFPEK